MSRVARLAALPRLAALAALLHACAAHAAFERPSLDAESAALGGLVATSTDPVFGNPGALARRAGASVRFDLSRPFGLADLSEGQISVARNGSRFGVGAGMRRFGANGAVDYAEREARVAVAAAPGGASVGVAVRGLEVSGAGLDPVRSVAVDAAFRVTPFPGADVGGLVEAVAGEIPGDPAGEHRRAAIGVARDFGPSLRLAVEVQRRGEEPLAGVIGLVWRALDALELRAGLRQEPVAPSCGFSLRLAPSRVDVAVTSTEPLGTTVRIGVRLEGGG